MKEIIIKVKGMVCNGCENRVQNVVSQIEGVEKAVANYKEGTVTITSSTEIDQELIKERIEDIGFEIQE